MQLFSHSLTNSDSPDIVLECRGRVPCVCVAGRGAGGGAGGGDGAGRGVCVTKQILSLLS